jgi:hypothetical protein
MLYGSVAGAAEVTANHPFWTMKTRMQRKLPFTLKPNILYRGIVPNAMSMMPITALQTTTFYLLKSVFFTDTSNMTTSQLFSCALMSGAITSAISCPTELLMTIQGEHGSFYRSGQYLVKHCGWKSIYNGIAATAMRDGIFTAGYLAGSPIVKEYIQAYTTNEFAAGIGGGIVAGLCSTVASQTADTIKTEQQSTNHQVIDIKAASRNIVSKSGIYGLFCGGLPRGIRVVSAVTIMSIVVESMKAKFG